MSAVFEPLPFLSRRFEVEGLDKARSYMPSDQLRYAEAVSKHSHLFLCDAAWDKDRVHSFLEHTVINEVILQMYSTPTHTVYEQVDQDICLKPDTPHCNFLFKLAQDRRVDLEQLFLLDRAVRRICQTKNWIWIFSCTNRSARLYTTKSAVANTTRAYRSNPVIRECTFEPLIKTHISNITEVLQMC